MADAGHAATDKMLEKLEKKIVKEYNAAEKSIWHKLNAYLKQFKEADKQQKALVQQGLLSKEDYQKWRTAKIATGKRWEDLRDVLSQDLANATLIARKMTGEHMKDVYALNANYGTYEIENGASINTSFTLYDHATVERLMKEDPKILPDPGKKTAQAIAEGKAKRWSNKQLQSVMIQSILQGESIPDIAKRLASVVGDMEKHAAIRAARTMTTGAENAGRVDSYKRAKDMGIELDQVWLATLDGRTRHEHRLLDGQKCEVGGKFKVGGEEIAFPGDPTAPAHLVYNCRCTLIAAVKGTSLEGGLKGLERNSKLGSMSYDEWKHEREKYLNLQKATPHDYGLGISGISNAYRDGARQILDNAPDFIRNAWDKTQDKMLEPSFEVSKNSGSAYFDGGDKKVHFKDETKAYIENTYQRNYACYFHERGHNIDYLLGDNSGYDGGISVTYKDGAFGKALQHDIEQNLLDYYSVRNNAYFTDWNILDDFDILKRGSERPGGIELSSTLRQFASAQRTTMGREWSIMVKSEINDAQGNTEALRAIFDKYFRNNEYVQMEVRSERNFFIEYDRERKDVLKDKNNAMDFASEVKSAFSLYERADIADMFDAYYCWNYNESYVLGVGHGADYFGTRGDGWSSSTWNVNRMSMEAFAEMYSATCAQPESLKTIKQFFPTAYNVFEEMLKNL